MLKIFFILLLFAMTTLGQGLPPTSTKGSGDSTFKTTFQFDFDTIPLTHSGTKATVGTIPVSKGGTGQTTASGALNAIAPFLVQVTGSVRAQSHNGLWILDNATYDPINDQFNRIDTTKYAYAMNFRAKENIPYEAGTTGIIWWRAQNGSNPINNTYGTAGGWENMFLTTQFRDMVVGGYGIEIDGNGIIPYGRVSLNTQSSKNYFGLLTNIFNDYSGVDSGLFSSWRVAINQTDDKFVFDRAPSASSTTMTNVATITASGDMTLAGRDLALGGSGITVKSRLISNTQSAKNYAGIMTNVNSAYTAYDDNTKPSWRDAINQTDDKFVIARAAASSTTFVDLASLSASGDLTLAASPASGDHSKKVATTEFVNYKRECAAQVNNVAGTVSVVTQRDGMLGDCVASVSFTSTGRVVVNFKSGFFTGTPVVVCSPYGSVNNNWLCSVNNVSASSVEIYTFNSGTTLTDFHFTIHALGVK